MELSNLIENDFNKMMNSCFKKVNEAINDK